MTSRFGVGFMICEFFNSFHLFLDFFFFLFQVYYYHRNWNAHNFFFSFCMSKNCLFSLVCHLIFNQPLSYRSFPLFISGKNHRKYKKKIETVTFTHIKFTCFVLSALNFLHVFSWNCVDKKKRNFFCISHTKFSDMIPTQQLEQNWIAYRNFEKSMAIGSVVVYSNVISLNSNTVCTFSGSVLQCNSTAPAKEKKKTTHGHTNKNATKCSTLNSMDFTHSKRIQRYEYTIHESNRIDRST